MPPTPRRLKNPVVVGVVPLLLLFLIWGTITPGLGGSHRADALYAVAEKDTAYEVLNLSELEIAMDRDPDHETTATVWLQDVDRYEPLSYMLPLRREHGFMVLVMDGGALDAETRLEIERISRDKAARDPELAAFNPQRTMRTDIAWAAMAMWLLVNTLVYLVLLMLTAAVLGRTAQPSS